MSSYRTHPLNKRARPNLTDMFDNGRLDKYTKAGHFAPDVHFARAVFTGQAFRHIMNKAFKGSEGA